MTIINIIPQEDTWNTIPIPFGPDEYEIDLIHPSLPFTIEEDWED